MDPITLMLVDDNPRFLSAARRFIDEIEEFTLGATLEGGRHAVKKAKELNPDVALVDLAMPDIAGLQLIPMLHRALPKLGIIALTVHDNPQYRQAAISAGADAFITKSKILKELEPTVKNVVTAHRQADALSLSNRILVMDDDPGLRNVYRKALRHKGFDVDLASTINEAREYIESNQYGVFICD
ncbi:MAG: response regulator, partial [Anaerolineae bacterium]|nr:response regulator [Anaerolineae bacterium]